MIPRSPRTMKFSPLRWRAVGVGRPELEEPTPKATVSARAERRFSEEPSMPAWPAPQSKHENGHHEK
jgi:hypothetical protein